MAQIHEKLAAIMGEAGAIGKDRKNAEQGFLFRGIDTVMNHLHPLFAKHGVVILPCVVSERAEQRTTRSNAIMTVRILTIRFDFCAADGSVASVQVVGEGADMGDKATNKAMAIALKYALTQMLLIPFQEVDPDAETMPESGKIPPAARATAPAAKPAAKPATPAAPQERVAAPQANRGEPPQGEFPSNLEINQGTFTGVVQGVNKKPGTNKRGEPWTRYGVTLFGVDGIFGTFRDDEGILASECAVKGQRVEVAWERNGKFLNLKGVMPVIQAEKEERKKDDLPF